MNPLDAKRKMFQEMKDVSQADGADALRAKYAPPPGDPAEEMGEPDAQPVPGAEEEAGMDAGGLTEADIANMSEDELRALVMQLEGSK